MTQGLYGALEEATGSEQANKEIAQIVVEQFGVQSTLTGVAQGVVDRVVRVHHDQYMQVVKSIKLLLDQFINPFYLLFRTIITRLVANGKISPCC